MDFSAKMLRDSALADKVIVVGVDGVDCPKELGVSHVVVRWNVVVHKDEAVLAYA